MLTILAKLLKALNSEQSPNQLAMAICLSAVLGLTPLMSLHNIFVVLIALWFRVNLSILIVSYPFFALLGFLLSPLFESVGLSILQAKALIPVWESFFNTVVGRWSNFYFSGVIGSLVIALASSFVLFPVTRIAVDQYREKLLTRFEKFKVTRMLKASKFWQLYSD